MSGGKFALLMLIGGFFIERYFEDQSLSDYLTAGETWYRTLFYLVFFGIFVGLDNWFRKEWKG